MTVTILPLLKSTTCSESASFSADVSGREEEPGHISVGNGLVDGVRDWTDMTRDEDVSQTSGKMIKGSTTDRTT